MQRSDFRYELPAELVAQRPEGNRSASRLLSLDGASGAIGHHVFADVATLLDPGDLLVMNDTRVIPARLFATKESGGRVEILIERLTGSHTALAHLRASRTPRVGSRLSVHGTEDAAPAARLLEVGARQGDLFCVRSSALPLPEMLDACGHVPLPPYIDRRDEPVDRERYQTVYARRPGAVAAPTAGLHFTGALLAEMDARGIQRTAITLHVGAGTFQPVREERVEDHVMHSEYLEVGEETCAAVCETRRRGGRVVAVGTTAVRALETASAASGQPVPYSGETDIFIYPGYRFRCVDALITNFHLPESTLLMLVSAFAGRERILAAYARAVRERYRFFSYGDAMFLTIDPAARELP